MKRYFKTISVILSILIIFQSIPTNVFAENVNQAKNEKVEAAKNTKPEEKIEAKILGEVAEKREKNIKHFRKDDNSYEAVVYPVPVHYLDKGQWKEIDNSLVESSKGQNKVLKNKQNDFQVEFSKNAKTDKLIQISKDKYELSWSVENVENSLANVSNGSEANLEESFEKEASSKIEKNEKVKALNSSEKDKIKKVIIENEKKKSSAKATSSAEFKQILPNIDLKYDLQGDTIKENITINKQTKDLNISFRINTKGLLPRLEKDNTILFLDEKDNKPVFKMNAPYMYDSKGAESNKIEVSLNKIENAFVLNLKPNAEWLNNSERLYPVVIDPPVETSLNINDIRDTFVCSSDTEDKANNIFLRVGNTPGVGITRSYLKFALPQLNSAEMVTKAVLNIYSDSIGTGGAQVNVHNVTNSWNTPGILWGNKPNYDTRVEDYAIVNGAGWYYPDVTRIVKEWYNNGSNNGIMLKASNESSGYVAFRSSDTTYTNARPSVTINYVNNSGLESYWTYHTQDMGRAGTAYINDYTGNLVLIHDDLTMSGNRMPINLKHVYNSNDKDINIGMGKGWRLSYNLEIHPKDFVDGKRYEYIDEDGTKHYFKAGSDGIYKDESGLDLTLTINPGGSSIIKDKKNKQIYFTYLGYLDKIVDSNGNVLEVNYSSGKIYKVTDGSGRISNIGYRSDGRIGTITDPSGRTTSFEYKGDFLNKVTYPDGKCSMYWYNANGALYEIDNYDGHRMTYTYTNTSPYRVSKVYEDNTNGTAGKEMSIAYEQNLTTFTDLSDSRNRKNYYQFNDYGNTTCIVDQDGRAQYYKYFDDSINRNKMQLASKLQKTVTNPIMNHNAEISDLYWVGDNWTGAAGTETYTTEDKYIGNKSLKVTKSNVTSTGTKSFFSYQINLTKGKTYTFSAYVKTAGISNSANKGAGVFVNYQDSAGNWKTVDSSFINGTNDWQRTQTIFTLPTDAASNTVYLREGITDESGTAYFDCMQLDEGAIANRYNLVDNSDLFYASNYQPTFWTPDADNNPDVDRYTDIDGRSAFRIVGSSGKRKNIYHTVNVSGKKGDNLILSGWAKADAVPQVKDSGREFSLCAGIERTDGTFQWVFTPFNSDTAQWQYISDVIIPDSDYKSVRVYAIYYKNENSAYFDSIQLYKEEFGTSYAYDDKGNVKSTQDLDKQNSTFEYSTNNDLIKSTNPKGNQFKYEYDSKHNVTKATSAENVVYSFSYDSNGNPLTSRIGDSTLFIQSSASYTASGNYTKTTTDSFGNTVSYNFDEAKDTLDTVTDANNNSTFNSYDNMDRLTSVYSIKGNTPVEVFPMNGSTTGSKGTKATKDTSVYATDENGKQVLSAYNGSMASYNLGINKNYGTISTWFNTKAANATRYIVVNDGSNTALLNMYIGADNKLKLAVRDTATNWKEFITSADTISINTWYFAAFSWNLNGSNLECNLYLNDKVYSGTVSNILDFSGGITTIGATSKGSDNLNGQLEQFSFSNSKLTTSEINQGANSIYGRGRGNYLSSIYVSNKYSYTNDRISSISHNGFNYNFEYDSFGNNTKTSVGSQNLITNQYEARTGRLLQSTYGNGHVINFGYDALDRLTSKKYNGAPRYNYAYDAAGNLGFKADLVNGVNYNYIYDTANRLVRIQDSIGNKISYDFDLNNNLSKIIDNINGKIFTTSYVYDKDDRLKELSLNNGAKQINTYDSLGRISSKALNTGTAIYSTTYNYAPGINGSTTTKVANITNNGVAVSYTYDKNGNIETINKDQIKYYYNELNELIREDNKDLNRTIVYTYDAGGNITSKIEYAYTTGTPTTVTKTFNYTYGDSNWRDKLTSFKVDGEIRDITYDQIGNLKTYNGFTYEWEEGRLLKSLSDGVNTFTYKYNDAGIRTEKNVNGVVTKYHLVGDKVTYEESPTDKIYYTYDSLDKLVSMNLNGVEYYYIRNAQGDVIGLFDKTGTQVVAYTYDPWGKTDTSGTLKDTVGTKNPYRYRGYRIDNETGYYYLQSRYYNAQWGRFINSDGIIGEVGELLNHNLFAYCKNNPVNKFDPDGYRTARQTIVDIEIVTIFVAVIFTAFINAGKAVSNVGKAIAREVSSTIKNTTSSIKQFAKRSKNKLKPDPNAKGEHSTFKRDPNTGEITNWRTWNPNPKNPHGFDDMGGYDGVGSPHTNPVTGEDLMPHVHDDDVPGNVRRPKDWEVPGKPKR